MDQSPRRRQPEPLIIATIIDQKSLSWSDETRKVAGTDAERVLEALIAEVGIEGTRRALTNQGFKAESYGYLLNHLYTEAAARRARLASS